MRIAISIWNDRIAPVFDVSRNLMIMDIEGGDITGRFHELFAEDNPLYKRSRLSALKVDTLICGAISRPFAELLAAGGIHTIGFVTGDKECVIEAFLEGNLAHPQFCMPGAGARHRQMGGMKKPDRKARPGKKTAEPKRGDRESGEGRGKGRGQARTRANKGAGQGGGQKRGRGRVKRQSHADGRFSEP